jgi:hypothetical protein
MPRARTRTTGAPSMGRPGRVRSTAPPMRTHPSSSTAIPSGTITLTPPMIAQAVISTVGDSMSALRRSMVTPPQKAKAVIRSAARHRPRGREPPMMAMKRRRPWGRDPEASPVEAGAVGLGTAGGTAVLGTPGTPGAPGAGGGERTPAGRSPTTWSSSSRVRAAKTSPARSANSSSVSRPSPVARLRASITCCRSASPMRVPSGSVTGPVSRPPPDGGRPASTT